MVAGRGEECRGVFLEPKHKGVFMGSELTKNDRLYEELREATTIVYG
jgi:hypothetical protein